MKNIFLATFLLFALLTFPVSATTHLSGKVIALDAGHGGTQTGAVNVKYGVSEKDVNLEVVFALQILLEAAGAEVVLTHNGTNVPSTRRERVNIAIEKCKTETTQKRKCDVLLSVHHNGTSDPTHDGTLVIYNEKKDIKLASAMLNALVLLTGQDEGYLHGGYGMTVYGNLVSVITEAYYITNDSEVEQYLAGTRVAEEAQAQFDGLADYFLNNSDDGGNGNKGGNGKGKNQ